MGVVLLSLALAQTMFFALAKEEAPAAQWQCNCEGTYDVCSLTTCYHHEQCTLSGKSMNNSKIVGVEAAAGNHQWACDCQGLRGYCSLTTCYSDCSAGVPMKSAAKSETAKAALPAEGGQKDKSLESPAAQWNCSCPGTYDVCSLTTCYDHEQCTLSGKSMNNSKTVGVEAAAGDHQWACDCQGLRGYCSLTTCYCYCKCSVFYYCNHLAPFPRVGLLCGHGDWFCTE